MNCPLCKETSLGRLFVLSDNSASELFEIQNSKAVRTDEHGKAVFGEPIIFDEYPRVICNACGATSQNNVVLGEISKILKDGKDLTCITDALCEYELQEWELILQKPNDGCINVQILARDTLRLMAELRFLRNVVKKQCDNISD